MIRGVEAVLVHVVRQPEPELPQVRGALDRLAAILGRLKRRQQDADQQRDDRDDDQKLDQSERTLRTTVHAILQICDIGSK